MRFIQGNNPVEQIAQDYKWAGRTARMLAHYDSGYTRDGDLFTLTLTDNFGPVSGGTVFGFRYDGLHRLRAADSSDPSFARYKGRFRYSPAGNIATVRIDLGGGQLLPCSRPGPNAYAREGRPACRSRLELPEGRLGIALLLSPRPPPHPSKKSP